MSTVQILVAEDKGLATGRLERMLKALGYSVQAVVSTGKEALAQAGAVSPDLVLIDILLEGDPSGLQAAEEMSRDLDIPVVFLTTQTDDALLTRARVAEPYGYVVRPFEEGQLYCAIEAALQTYWMQGALRESERRFRSLIEHVSDLVAILDGDGVICYVSPSCRQFLGQDERQLAGESLAGFLHPEDVGRFTGVFREVLHQGVTRTAEYRLRHQDGAWRMIETVLHNRMGDPMVAGLVVHARDVTRRAAVRDSLRRAHDELEERLRVSTAELAAARAELKQESAGRQRAETALAEGQRRYCRLLDSVTSYRYAVHFQNGHPVRTEHGEGCGSVTGYSPEDYATDSSLWISMVHPDDRDQVRDHVAQVTGREPVPPLEHRILRRDGTLRWIRDTIIRHVDEEGEVVRYDGVIEDITERKEAEDELRDKEIQLAAAQKIQQRLLPKDPPQLPGLEIAAALIPAEYAAGDYFDFLSMPDDHVGLAVGDVSGHGFAPALIMAFTHVLLRALAEQNSGVVRILNLANATLTREIEDERFVTLFLARLDPLHRSLIYASAGHPPGYVMDRSGNIKARLESTGIPLGILADASFEAKGPVVLDPGDIVLLVTDGIAEARSPSGELFGTERAIQMVRDHRGQCAWVIADRLCDEVRRFAQRKAPTDDVTALVVKVL